MNKRQQKTWIESKEAQEVNWQCMFDNNIHKVFIYYIVRRCKFIGRNQSTMHVHCFGNPFFYAASWLAPANINVVEMNSQLDRWRRDHFGTRRESSLVQIQVELIVSQLQMQRLYSCKILIAEDMTLFPSVLAKCHGHIKAKDWNQSNAYIQYKSNVLHRKFKFVERFQEIQPASPGMSRCRSYCILI